MKNRNAPIPIALGELMEISVSGMASSGDGLFSKNGYTIFIPGCIPGDKVLAKVAKINRNFGVCTTEKFLLKSPLRATPFCSFFDDCGGCQLQHLLYEEQLRFKKKVVLDTLMRIGNVSLPKEITVIPALHPFSYRSRGIFAVGKTDGKIRIGFYKRNSHDIVDIDHCPILLDPINEILRGIRSILVETPVPVYNEDTHQGLLRKIVIRGSLTNGKFLVGFVTNRGQLTKQLITKTAKLNSSLSKMASITGIVQNINTKKTNIILGEKNRTLWGSPSFSDKVGDLVYLLSLPSFFQVNPLQMAELNETVADYLYATKKKILDAYCGNGSISLWLAKKGKEIIGVEENESAISDAKKSATKNNLENCTFISSSMEDFLLSTFEQHQAIVLNPPRAGCSMQVLNSVIKNSPEIIVYVSCKPSTLARDLKTLCNQGYTLKKMSIIDMFPQTIHMETLVLLEKER